MAVDCIAVTVGEGMLCAQRLRKDRDKWMAGKEAAWPMTDERRALAAEEQPQGEEGPLSENEAFEKVQPPSLSETLQKALTDLGGTGVALAVNTDQVICTIFKVPLAARDDLRDIALLEMDKLSPFDDDEHTIGFEVLGETADDLIVFAAAVPFASLAGWEGALIDTRTGIVRVDVSILAWWRGLIQEGLTGSGRQVVLVTSRAETDILILDDGIPIVTRGIGSDLAPEDFTREILFSCLNAEVDFGPKPIETCHVFTLCQLENETFEAIAQATQCPAPEVTVLDSFTACTRGLALRTIEGAPLDLTPPHWLAREKEAATKKKMLIFSAIAGGIWLLITIILFSGPAIYRHLTARTNNRANLERGQYNAVVQLKDRVEMLERYTNSDRSVLEVLRALIGDMPEGIVFSSITYRHDQGLRFSGDSPTTAEVYALKDLLDNSGTYAEVKISQLAVERRTQRQRFDIEANFKGLEE